MATFSNDQLDKAVVVGNVALEDVHTWTHDTFESPTIKFNTFQTSLGLHCSCTWAFEKQGNFTCRNGEQ